MKERNAMKSFLAILTLGAIGLAATFPGSSTIPEVYDLADNGGTTDYFDVPIDQFDPALGTLVSVTMAFSADWDRTYSFENTSASSRALDITFDQEQGDPPRQMVEVLIGSFLEDLNEIKLVGGVNIGGFLGYDGTTDFAGTSGGTHLVSTDAAASPDTQISWEETSITITDSGVLSALTGTGTYDIDILMDSDYQAASYSPSVMGVATSLENVILVVTYNYN